MDKWAIAHIFEFLPSGGPGPDGITPEDLSKLDEDSLGALVDLFNEADNGRFPQFWTQARATLIPKPDSTDRRPITILSVCYRLWAKRHSKALTSWLASWCPPSVRGAMPGSGAADVVSELNMRLDNASAGLAPTAFLLSLDQSQCFYRIDLVNLLHIIDHLDLVMCYHVVDIYSRIIRHVFTDGQPSDVLIGDAGDYVSGIPQGCPFATFFYHLQGVVWLLSIQQHCADAKGTTYLDDWLVEAKSWQDVVQVWKITEKLMAAFGPFINVGKSCVATVTGSGPKPGKLPQDLANFNSVVSFKYLGVDVMCDRSRTARPTG